MPLISLILFFIAGAGTPGPNNTIAMASGASYGMRKSIPAVVGINLGFPTMILVVGLGLGQVLQQWPVVLDIIRPIGVAYLLWLAYQVATGPTAVEARGQGRPPGLVKMALFQFVNPKAWTLAVAALASFTGFGGSFFWEVAVIVLFAMVFSTPCTLAWVLLGVGAGKLLSTPRQLRVFNLVMAALLVASLIPALSEIWASLQPLMN